MRKLLKNKLPAAYLTDEARGNTVAIWGSSKDAEILTPYYPVVEEVVKGLLERGKKVVHGAALMALWAVFIVRQRNTRPKMKRASLWLAWRC